MLLVALLSDDLEYIGTTNKKRSLIRACHWNAQTNVNTCKSDGESRQFSIFQVSSYVFWKMWLVLALSFIFLFEEIVTWKLL